MDGEKVACTFHFFLSSLFSSGFSLLFLSWLNWRDWLGFFMGWTEHFSFPLLCAWPFVSGWEEEEEAKVFLVLLLLCGE